MKPLGKTAQSLADTFLELAMERGYNAVSYADLAKRLGIRTASIHYHFPTKSDLGVTVLRRYKDATFKAVSATSPDNPQSYRDAFEGMLEPARSLAKVNEASCLVGVLGAEFPSLPEAIKSDVRNFLDEQEQFLTHLLGEGRTAGAFAFDGEAKDMAKMIASTLQGAILIKKARGDSGYLDSILAGLQRMIMPPS